jgi:hypothetical protein
MSFEIRHAETNREAFSEYRYDIYENGTLVAHYWHDYRGDDHGFEFLDGKAGEPPVLGMVAYVTGGGPQPLKLTELAEAYLNKMLGR